MDKVGLNREPLYGFLVKAIGAMRELYTELHYLACDGGVFRKREE
jgi:hypothetical protein